MAACGGGESAPDAPSGPQIARPGEPVTLTIYDDNPPIEDGLDPEQGPLKVFNWTDYVYKKSFTHLREGDVLDVNAVLF